MKLPHAVEAVRQPSRSWRRRFGDPGLVYLDLVHQVLMSGWRIQWSSLPWRASSSAVSSYSVFSLIDSPSGQMWFASVYRSILQPLYLELFV